MKIGTVYDISEKSLLFEATYLGKFFGLKGESFSNDEFGKQKQEVQIKSLKWTDYPIHLFYTKNNKLKIVYSLKKAEPKEIKKGETISLKQINKKILNFLINNEDDKNFNYLLWDSYLYFSKTSNDEDVQNYLKELKKNKISFK